MNRIQAVGAALLVLSLLAGCAHYPVNDRWETPRRDVAYDFDSLAQNGNSDSLFVCLSFSGGGTRAAAFAYGVMEELRRTRIVIDGVEKRLLDEVDCISSVSGGSFTAAYYGLFRERLFSDFRARFLDRDIQWTLIGRVANPANWFRLASPTFNRIDLAAELYEEEVFDRARFADLQRSGRPLLMINATNVESGARFSFLPSFFDAMGSDLGGYPLARAVAASSAFPFLLSPISLVNYPLAAGYQPPWRYPGALEAREVSRHRYQAAQELVYYLDKTNRYVHVMDGGLGDNIGVRAIYDAFARGFIRKRINDERIKRLVVIVVNAQTEAHEDLGKRESPPGLKTVALKTATVSMDNYSYESISLLVEELQRRVQAQKDVAACDRLLKKNCPNAPSVPPLAGIIDPYVIELKFSGAAGMENEDPRYYLELPTSFALDKTQVDRLIALGPRLLNAAPQFSCLTRVLSAEGAGQPRPADCPVGAGITGY